VRLAPSPADERAHTLLETPKENVMSLLQATERPSTRRTVTLVQSTTARPQTTTRAPCPHHPRCPAADAVDHAAARVVAAHPEQGWSLLCNGVISFDDTGELLPGGIVSRPRRGPAPHRAPSSPAA
jgi:hypothetical protein